jgi:hypothetical protein
LNVTYSGLYVDAECDAVSGQIGVLRAQFSFTDDWNEFPEKTAVFCGSGSSVSVLLGESLSCEVPSEVTEKPGKLVIGVFATVQDADGRIRRYPGKPATVEIGSGTPIVDTLPGDDEISSYEQLLYRLMAVEDALDESINRANTAAAGAESAAASADTAAGRATGAAVKAETNAESAKTAAEVATRTASAANKAAQNADRAASDADNAAKIANASADYAYAKGLLAEERANYASREGQKTEIIRDQTKAAADSARMAATDARTAAKAANEAAAFARENGETAWNQAAYANEEATNAYSAAEDAKDVTWRAREAVQKASEAATLASMNSDFAREAGRYAYGIIGNLYRDAVLPFTEAEISETGEFSGFETNPDFYNTGKTYFRYKTDNGVSFKWTNPRPEKGSLKITMCAYGQYEEHFTSSMNVHYTDGTQDSFEFTHGVTVVYDTDKTKTVESMTGGPYVSDYGYQPWILLDMDVMSIIASYLIPQSDWLAEEGEAGHILNRTHYQTVSNAPGYMPYDECDVEALGVGTHLVFKPTNETHFKKTYVYENMRAADPFTYNVDYSCFYPPTGGEISFKYRAEQMVVNTLFTLIDSKNYRLVQFSSGVTAYVILDVNTLTEEYKSKFPEIGIYLDVEESVYTNRKITIQVVRVYRLNELYIPDTIARKTDIPEGGTGGESNEVYIGSEQPTDENVKLWVDPNGESDIKSEVWEFTLEDGTKVVKTVVIQ